MKINLKNYINLFIFLVVFLVFYFLALGQVRYFLIYMLIPAGLYFAFKARFSPGITCIVGLILLITLKENPWWIDTWVLIIMLITSALIPFRFLKRYRKESEKFKKSRNSSLETFDSLNYKLSVIHDNCKNLQDEVEKITRLYILGRESVEHMDLESLIDHLAITLLGRPGIKSISIFSVDKRDVKPIYFSKSVEKQDIIELIKNNQSSFEEKSPFELKNKSFPKNESLVVWPVHIGESTVIAFILTLEPNHVNACLDEGKIFIPQISLGFNRVKLFEEVKEKSRKDSLTGLYLRRYFLERLEEEMQRAKRYESSFSILMIDIDHFKRINDTHGHVVGDNTLQAIAKILETSLRPVDLIGRYGGEEFVVLLSQTSIEESTKIANKIREKIGKHKFHGNKRIFKLAVSIGISHYPNDGHKTQDLLRYADKALYWAKTHGRNATKTYKEIASKI
ncbi:GGDEF domain-containing protein [Elusimicrobiota bacterium]